MATLGDIYDLVRAAINRGTKFDADIVAAVRQAARWIERNHTLKYMEILLNFTLPVGSSSVTVGFSEFKSQDFLRIPLTTTPPDFAYLNYTDPTLFDELEDGRPTQYWIETGTKKFVFDRKADQNYSIEFFGAQYSVWSTATNATHWLFDNAEDLLVAQSMFFLAPIVRAPELWQMFKAIRDEAVQTAMRADDEFRYTSRHLAQKMFVG